MPGTAVVHQTYGLADWTDYFNNWTAGDAEHIQKRTIVRFLNETTRSAGLTPEAGLVTFINTPADGTTGGALEWCGSDLAYRRFLSPAYLRLSESSTVVGLKLSANSAVVNIKASTVELGPTQALIVGSTLIVKTGAATAVLTTTTDSLNSDIKITAPAATFSGAVTGSTFTGAVIASTVSAATSVTAGAISLTNSTGAIAGTSVTATAAVTGATVTGGTAKLATTSSTAELSSVTGGHTAYVRLTADAVVKGTNVKFDGAAKLSTTGLTEVPVAGVVVATVGSALVATNYPNGTFWVQT